jgi:hypothetical protein
MKKTNILYWTFTGIFAAFMFFSSIPNIIVTPESVAVIGGLGYPTYIIPFLGVAKVLGAIAILVPGFPRLKEWAYAGFFFDLSGATYSAIAKEGFQPAHTFMLVFFAFFTLSYVFYHKRQRQLEANPVRKQSAVMA